MTFARHWTGTSRDALAWVGSVKLVFINRFFYPDHSATSQLLSDLAFALAARDAQAGAAPVWTRLELIENTVEGSAFDRCQVEAPLEKGQTVHWRVFYGEARADSESGWSVVRPSSGCAQTGGDEAALWTQRGSPYFLVDVALNGADPLGREVLIEAALSATHKEDGARDTKRLTLTGTTPPAAAATSR